VGEVSYKDHRYPGWTLSCSASLLITGLGSNSRYSRIAHSRSRLTADDYRTEMAGHTDRPPDLARHI